MCYVIVPIAVLPSLLAFVILFKSKNTALPSLLVMVVIILKNSLLFIFVFFYYIRQKA